MDKRALHTLTDEELYDLLAEIKRLKDRVEKTLTERRKATFSGLSGSKIHRLQPYR